jgi:hypothetical protein
VPDLVGVRGLRRRERRHGSLAVWWKSRSDPPPTGTKSSMSMHRLSQPGRRRSGATDT